MNYICTFKIKKVKIMWEGLNLTNYKHIQDSIDFDGDVVVYLPECPHIDLFTFVNKSVNYKSLKKYLYKLGHYIFLLNSDLNHLNLYNYLLYMAIKKSNQQISMAGLNSKLYKMGIKTNNKDEFSYNYAFELVWRERILNMVDKIINQTDDFKFKSLKVKPRIVFNPDYDLTDKEKQQLKNEILGQNERDKYLNQVIEALQSMKEKGITLSQRAVTKFSGISRNTVRKYWEVAITELENDYLIAA